MADGMHRIEGGHGLLKDHGEPVAAHAAHLVFRLLQQIFPVEQDLPFRPAHFRQQPHEGEGGHRFAAATLPDDAKGFSGIQVKIQMTHGAGRAVIG